MVKRLVILGGFAGLYVFAQNKRFEWEISRKDAKIRKDAKLRAVRGAATEGYVPTMPLRARVF